MAIDSTSKLIEYCLRRLGKPVINIEIDDTQSKERIQDAINFFIERHFDGAEEIFFKKTIFPADVTNGYLTIDGGIIAITEYLAKSNSSSIEIFDQAEWNYMDQRHRSGASRNGGGGLVDYYMTQSYINTLNIITGTPNYNYSFNKSSNRFFSGSPLTSVGSGNLLKYDASVDMSGWTTINSTLTLNDAIYPNGELEASTITSTGVSTFGITETIDTKFYVRGTYTSQIILKSGTYTGQVELEFSDRDGNIIKTETVTPNNVWQQFFVSGTYDGGKVNDIIIKVRSADSAAGAGETFFIHSKPSVYKNNFIVLKGYKALSTDDIEIFEDRYLQRLATAYIKHQWGSNLKKYSGMNLPGGVEINGQQIYDEANEEINTIENEIVEKFESLPDILIG